jgi:hypothetical protein
MTGNVQLLPKANHLYSLYDNVDTFNSSKLFPFGYAPLDDSVDLLNSRTAHRFDEFRKRVDEVYNNMTDEEKRVYDKVVDILAEPDLKTRRAMASSLTAQEFDIWKDMNSSGKFNPYFKTPKNAN